MLLLSTGAVGFATKYERTIYLTFTVATRAIWKNRLEPSEYDTPSQMYARLHFTLLSHPTVRYRRYVVNDLLDVIVSVGSAVSLFMGASILSIFELPYWLFIRRDRIA